MKNLYHFLRIAARTRHYKKKASRKKIMKLNFNAGNGKEYKLRTI